MKNKIFRIFSSSIKIRVTGRNVNNFIKKMVKNKINIGNILPISYNEVDIIIDYNDLEKVNRLKSIYDIEIKNYYGKLKMLKLLKKNMFIISFLILGLFIIYLLSKVVFNIEVIHSNSRIVKLLEDELFNYGIKKYSFVKDFNLASGKKVSYCEGKRTNLFKND